MELHGIHENRVRKEITCSDCGHRYLIAQGQRGGRCLKCGNIEFLVDEELGGGAELAALSETIVARRVLPRLEQAAHLAPADPLLPFHSTPDGLEVEKYRMRYQVEWQLWAALVKDFQNPALHMAYICQAAATTSLDQASVRYLEHRSVMALLSDSRWQADVADLMLARIESLSAARLGLESGARTLLPDWLRVLPYDARAFRVGWVALGIILAAKILHYF